MPSPSQPTPEEWKRTKTIFGQALDLPPEDRHDFVRSASGDETGLLHAVMKLLQHHEEGESEDFMNQPVAEFDAGALHRLADDDNDPLLGRTVGNYTIKSVIGLGGMGVVYRAEQAAPKRDVALKLIRPGMATPTLLQRFEREAFLLGRVNHPGIARILELGTFTTDLGEQPYIAMELVHGGGLLDVAAERAWSIRERVRVMIHVCDIVQHAHQKGIIHRDLKPGNILVDDDDEPHVLDFGIARLIGDRRSEHDTQTVAGQVLGTIHYMSPEQLEGDPEDIDTQSDVYALGVVLYELLAGERPFKSGETRQFDLPYIICAGNPPRLSAKNRECKGELELIVHKAFDADRARRYSSAAALAEDLRRFLDHRPVSAHRDSAAYSIRKWLRRRKYLASMIAFLMVVVLTSGILISQAFEGRQAAEDLNDIVLQRVTQFGRAQLGPLMQPGARELPEDAELEEMAALYHEAENIDPEVRAQLGALVGEGYLKQNEYLAAESFMRPAYDFHATNRQWSLDHAATAYHLGRIVSQQWRLDEALTLYEECLKGFVTHLEPDDPRILSCRNDVAVCQRRLGRLTDSEETFRWLLEQRRIINIDEPFWIAASANNLGTCLKMQGRYEEARDLYGEAETIITSNESVNPVYVARCSRSIAECLNGIGDHAAARERLLSARQFMIEHDLADHADRAMCDVELAFTALALDDSDAALEWIESADAVFTAQTAFTRPHHWLTERDFVLAMIHLRRGNTALVTPLLQRIDEDLDTMVPDNHSARGRLHLLRAHTALRSGALAEVDDELLRAASSLVTDQLRRTYPDRLLLDYLHARTLFARDQFSAAASRCRDSMDRAQPDLQPDHWILRQLRVLLEECEGESLGSTPGQTD